MLEQTGKNASCENDSGAESYDSGLPAGLCGYLPVDAIMMHIAIILKNNAVIVHI